MEDHPAGVVKSIKYITIIGLAKSSIKTIKTDTNGNNQPMLYHKYKE
jgi:hypothetical protein